MENVAFLLNFIVIALIIAMNAAILQISNLYEVSDQIFEWTIYNHSHSLWLIKLWYINFPKFSFSFFLSFFFLPFPFFPLLFVPQFLNLGHSTCSFHTISHSSSQSSPIRHHPHWSWVDIPVGHIWLIWFQCTILSLFLIEKGRRSWNSTGEDCQRLSIMEQTE